MSTTTTNNFTINGIIDTNNSLIDNINTIATAATSWVTYDYTTGKWSVIINKVASSIKSFDDSNIIGNIDIIQTDLTGLYTGVTIEYPDKDLRNQTDIITLEVDSSQLFQTESEKILSLSFPIINNSIQAEYVGAVELNQNRLDKVIQFSTDYTSIGLKAGDVIDITNTTYGYTNKKFRITKLTEVDADDGTIVINITALEYDDAVYTSNQLWYEYRTRQTGILPRITNTRLDSMDDNDFLGTFGRLIGANVITGLLDWVLSEGEDGIKKAIIKTSEDIAEDALLCAGKPKVNIVGPTSQCGNGAIVLDMTTANTGCGTMKLPYTITGVDAADINVPLKGDITFTDGTAQFSITTNQSAIGKTLVFKIYCSTYSTTISAEEPESYTITANKTTLSECEELTFYLTAVEAASTNVPYTITGITSDDLADGSAPLSGNFILGPEDAYCTRTSSITLSFSKVVPEGTETIHIDVKNGAASMDVSLTDGASYSVSAAPGTITEGQSTTITCNIVGMADGVSVPYVISDYSGRVSTALTGTVVNNNGTASLTVNTIDDQLVQGSGAFTIKFGPTTGYGICYGQVTVYINDNDEATTCTFIDIPATWCLNLVNNVPVSVYACTTIKVYEDANGVDVPTALTITNGTISISSTTKVSTLSNVGGIAVNVPSGGFGISGTHVTATEFTTVYKLE